MLMVVVREQSLNGGINAQHYSLSSVFLCLLCQIPQSHFCCCSEAHSHASFQPSLSGLLTFHSEAMERKEEDSHLSGRHESSTFTDSISNAQTEAIQHHLATVAQLSQHCARFSGCPRGRAEVTVTPSVLLAWLRLYQKRSRRMKTALLFGLGERTRLGSAFKSFETHKTESADK